jgi:hypothetical protein
MALILTLGINGVGKDSLAKAFQERYQGEVGVLLSTRILFKAMGFDVNYVLGQPSPDAQELKAMYTALEQTPKHIVDAMINNEFRNTLLDFKKQVPLGILSAHLVAMRRQDDGTAWYETGFTYPWYADVFDGFAYIRSTPEEIFERRENERKLGIRDRGSVTLDEVAGQLKASDDEWVNFCMTLPQDKPTIIIDNIDGHLTESVNKLESFAQGLIASENIPLQMREIEL